METILNLRGNNLKFAFYDISRVFTNSGNNTIFICNE